MSVLKKMPSRGPTPVGPPGRFSPKMSKERGIAWSIGMGVVVLLLLLGILTEYWGQEPDRFDVQKAAMEAAGVENVKELPLGYAYATAIIEVAQTLLHKPGGFLSNDMFPPGVFMDNMPGWEYGALTALRDGTSALRNHIARAQSQSKEDADLAKAEPMFYFDHKSWQLPSSESEYFKGVEAMEHYRERLAQRESQFYARADNLRQYLEILEKRLGSLSNRLSASAGDSRQLSPEQLQPVQMKTSWMMIDDVFFEARGYCWATIQILRAVEYDFRDILGNKTAMVSLQSIIHELEDGQAEFLSPVILNGGGFGLFANYSLTLANYIARANAATIDLRNLLQQG
ncbi:DUF2333 family protein [Methyloterricola oryzae]|uniref:DUF2333 family protein n=1 Tax=Methyloterricola oryzae TaxID=1495050 RepID=UPI0009E2DC6C|nr:DUF2333 family protein [Methyloterricola oryzae]